MREVRSIVTGCGEWVGTAHLVPSSNSPPEAADARPPGTEYSGLGCLLLNFGHMPRSGVGDLSCHIADHYAGLGLPTWRFDFPGLGDSPGNMPAQERLLFRQIQTGRFVEPALELVDALVDQTGIRSWILGGLCGGAVTAVLAAGRAPEPVAGMLLIDLDVSLLPESGDEGLPGPATGQRVSAQAPAAAASASEPAGRPRGSPLGRLLRRRTWVRFATGEGRLGGRLPMLRRAVGRWVAGKGGMRLPPDRNQPVVDHLRGLLSRGMPVLSIRARGKMRDIYADSVDQVLFGRAWPPRYQVIRLEGTNHVFTAGEGEGRILDAAERWLRGSVLPGGTPDSVGASPALECKT